MISDITLGQYFPQKSPLHATDPRLKICLLVYAIVLLFAAGNFASLALAVVYIGLGIAFSKIPCKLYWKSLKPIWFLVAFTGILNIFYGAGEPLWKFGIFQITLNGIYNAIFVSVRIIALILASSVLTFTTSPTQLTDAIERLLKPLAKLRVPVHEFAMMMTIALRFVPTLLEAASPSASGPWCRCSSPCLCRLSAGPLTWPPPWRAAATTGATAAPR